MSDHVIRGPDLFGLDYRQSRTIKGGLLFEILYTNEGSVVGICWIFYEVQMCIALEYAKGNWTMFWQRHKHSTDRIYGNTVLFQTDNRMMHRIHLCRH